MTSEKTRKGKERQRVVFMTLRRDSRDTVVERVKRDPAFARALLDEASTLFLSGEPETARMILRDLVNATLGFEVLARMTVTPPKSLHRMLSERGNPRMDNIAAVFAAISQNLNVQIKTNVVAATKKKRTVA